MSCSLSPQNNLENRILGANLVPNVLNELTEDEEYSCLILAVC